MTACGPAGFDRGRHRETVPGLRHWVASRAGPASPIPPMADLLEWVPICFQYLARAFRFEKRPALSLRLPPHPAVEVSRPDRHRPRNSGEKNDIGWPPMQCRRLVPRVTPADRTRPPAARAAGR